MTILSAWQRIVLGPQERIVTLDEVVAEYAPIGTIATITAGWQERELEDDELNERLGGRGRNLRLYERFDRVMHEDPELEAAHHELQGQLKELRRLYNVRLDRAMQAWADMMEWPGDRKLAAAEGESALAAIRELDRHHLERITRLRREYTERIRPSQRPAARREIDEIRRELFGTAGICVAGGHVAVLLSRLRLFDMAAAFDGAPLLIAWSAGAMALAPRVVLFHDSPPQGPGHAEAFDEGLGLLPDIVPLPHATRRLRLDDRGRISRFAQRFAPATPVVLEGGSMLWHDGQRWRAPGKARVLGVSGRTREQKRW